jgi:hypothetical protein
VGGETFVVYGTSFGRPSRAMVTIGTDLCVLLRSNSSVAECFFPQACFLQGEGTLKTVTLNLTR